MQNWSSKPWTWVGRMIGSALWILCSSASYALDTQVTLQLDSHIKPTNNELVTFGLPLKEGEVNELAQIKVSREGKEISAYVETGLRYHWSDNSLRSVTIQISGLDMTGGAIKLNISNDGARLPRNAKIDPAKGWAKAAFTKNHLPHPRVFALHDPHYLSDSGLIPPYQILPAANPFKNFQTTQFDSWAGDLNYAQSKRSDWLFDRASAMYKAYMNSGKIEHLKEAFLSKQFYFSHLRNDGVEPKPAGGSGCWTYGGGSCADGKYIYTQPAKLAWALSGDNSQWDEALINNMAIQADKGWNQPHTRDPFDGENEAFTERAAGLTGLAEINAYEISANKTLLNHLNERINSLYDMQQSVKVWDKVYGWTPKSGAWSHSIPVHEGKISEKNAARGDSNGRGFSPWMSENIVDFLWQSYWVTNNEKIPTMLRSIANATDLYGFTSSYKPNNGPNNNFETKAEFAKYSTTRSQSCNTTAKDTALLYFASKFADATTRSSDLWWKPYTDSHNIQTVLTLSTGYYFETDSDIRKRLKARIEKIIAGWSNNSCAKIGRPARLWNWQHRSNSVATWYWVATQTPPSVK